MTADSVCVHGDGPSALALVRSIREGLRREGIQIAPLAQVVSREREALA